MRFISILRHSWRRHQRSIKHAFGTPAMELEGKLSELAKSPRDPQLLKWLSLESQWINWQQYQFNYYEDFTHLRELLIKASEALISASDMMATDKHFDAVCSNLLRYADSLGFWLEPLSNAMRRSESRRLAWTARVAKMFSLNSKNNQQ